MTQRCQIGIRTVRLAFQAKVVLLRLLPMLFPKAEVIGALEQRRVVDVEPEGTVDVTCTQRQARQRSTIGHGRLKHRLLACRIAQLNAGHEVGCHPVAGINVGPDLNRFDQKLAGLRCVIPGKAMGHRQAVGGQEVAQRGIHRQLEHHVDKGLLHLDRPFWIGVEGLRPMYGLHWPATGLLNTHLAQVK